MWNKLRQEIVTVALSLTIATVSATVPTGSALAHDRGGWHGGGWGWGLGLGLATGLAVDAALGWPGYYARYPYAAYYPYAVPMAPPVTVIQQVPVVSAPPVATAPAAAAPAVQYWYYCRAPKGYYPYVPSCQSAWQMVPATPPGAVDGTMR